MAIVWGVQLRDQVTPAADAAAVAMGTAAQQAKVLQRAMAGAQAQATKMAALGDAAGVRKAAASYQVLKESFDALPPPVVKAQGRIDALTSSMKDKFHEGGSATEILKAGLESLGLSAGEAGLALGAMAAAAAAAAVTVVALAGAIYEGAKASIEASEHLERMRSVFDALGGGAKGAGTATIAMIRGLSKEIPQSEATIEAWARSLEAAGTTDLGALRNQLKAAAAAEALLGDGAGETTKNLFANLQEQAAAGGGKVKFSLTKLAGTGISENEFLSSLGMTPANFAAAKKAGTLTGQQISDAISKALILKGEGPLASQMDELSTLATKAKDSFMHLFEDVNIAPFTSAVREFFGVFDTALPSGQVMHDALTSAFNGVFQVAGKVFSFLKDAFLHVIIWSLQAAIFIKPLVREFKAWAEQHDLVGKLMTALKGVGIVLGSLAVAAGAVLAVGLALQFVASVIFGAVVGAVFYLIGLVPKAGEALGDLAFKAVQGAKDFISGFVDGIKNGVGVVVEAVKNMGHHAWLAIKSALGIASPSKLMIQAGLHTSHGFAAGVEQGTPDVAASARSMAATVNVAASPRRGGDSGGGGGSSSASVHIGSVTVHIDASHAASPAEMSSIVEEGLGSLAERLAAMIGAAPEPA